MGIGIKLHPVGREGSIITENEALKNLKQILENYINTTPPKYYPPVENLLDLIYETYTENWHVLYRYDDYKKNCTSDYWRIIVPVPHPNFLV